MAVTDDGERRLTCATYTHARRHPMVLGKIGNWTPPFQVTFPQLAVIVVALLVEYLTWQWWGARLPMVLALLCLIGLPLVLAWAVRRARIEGRGLVRAGIGYLVYLTKAPRGQVGGRAYHPQRRVTLEHGWMYVAPGGRGDAGGDAR